MAAIAQGDMVAVPCMIQAGPFADEKLVTVETEEGNVSGFVKLRNLRIENNSESGLVNGVVIAISEDSVNVRLFGSFFTTALGTVPISENFVQPLSAA